MEKWCNKLGLPYHWGYSGLVKGDIGNDLIAISEEPNVRIMESKGVLCTVLPGSRAYNAEHLADLLAPSSGISS